MGSSVEERGLPSTCEDSTTAPSNFLGLVMSSTSTRRPSFPREQRSIRHGGVANPRTALGQLAVGTWAVGWTAFSRKRSHGAGSALAARWQWPLGVRPPSRAVAMVPRTLGDAAGVGM